MKDDIKDQGTIAFWRERYGFITPDGGGRSGDIFVHVNIELGGEPRKGAPVSYHLAPDKRNPSKVMATDVQVLP